MKKTIELFCGTKSASKVFAAAGLSTFTVDIDTRFEPTVSSDVRFWRPQQECHGADILWASPPCQGFSVAVIGRNWNHDYTPKTDSARLAIELVLTTLRLIEEIQPKWWFIENPRGMLRKMPFMVMDGVVRHTVTYCQYGDTRQKPTDIWTNVPVDIWTPRPPCVRGASCHVAAPRGSRTGTQGLKGAVDRGRIPPALFDEILQSLQKHHESN